MTRTAMSVLFGLGLLAACGQAPGAVPVLGDVGALQGEWYGEYQSAATGRSGSISFTLRAGTDTAQGDVVMTPQGWDHPVQPAGQPGIPSAQRTRRRILSITFVRASGGTVTGRLDAYIDPQCGCDVMTTFEGGLRGDTLAGTFRSHHVQGGATRSGEWWVVRKKD